MQVLNINNGERAETYVIKEKRENVTPKSVFVDENNRIIRMQTLMLIISKEVKSGSGRCSY